MWVIYQEWVYSSIGFVIKAIWQRRIICGSERNREDLSQCLENTRHCFCELKKNL